MTFLVAQCTEQTSMKVLIQSTFFRDKEIVSSESKWKTKYYALKELFESRYAALFNMFL